MDDPERGILSEHRHSPSESAEFSGHLATQTRQNADDPEADSAPGVHIHDGGAGRFSFFSNGRKAAKKEQTREVTSHYSVPSAEENGMERKSASGSSGLRAFFHKKRPKTSATSTEDARDERSNSCIPGVSSESRATSNDRTSWIEQESTSEGMDKGPGPSHSTLSSLACSDALMREQSDCVQECNDTLQSSSQFEGLSISETPTVDQPSPQSTQMDNADANNAASRHREEQLPNAKQRGSPKKPKKAGRLGVSVQGNKIYIDDDPMLAKRKSQSLTAFRNFLTLGSASRRSSKANESIADRKRHISTAARHQKADDGYFEGPMDSKLETMVKEKMNIEGLNLEKATVAARVERMVQDHSGSEDAAMFFIVDKCPTEVETRTLLSHLITYGADVNSVDANGRSTIHAAVQRDFQLVAKVLLENESSAEKTDAHGRLAVEYAVENRRDEMASLLILHMDHARVRSLFESSEDPDDGWKKPLFNFHTILSDSSKMPKTAQAILDSFVDTTPVPDEYEFHFTVLESDSTGLSPGQSKFRLPCKTNFHRLLDIPDLRDHSVVRTLIFHKWNAFGERSTLKNILYYFMFILLTSFAFISAGRQRADGFKVYLDANNATVIEHGDPRQYPDAESYVRAICEVLLLLGTMFNLYSEIKEMSSSGCLDYWSDKYNYVQLTTVSLFIVLVPLRFTNVDEQWYIAAVTYIVVCLRTLQVISVTKVVGIYLQILIEIVKKDMSKFAIIFTIFWIMFSGSTYLVLVGTPYDEGTVTGTQLDKSQETNTYGNILLTGLRILAQDESVVDNFQDSFHWLAVVIMMFFLFTLLIVLLNILIAQLSDTYQEVKSNAQRTLEHNWSSALRTLELSETLKDLRYKSFTDSVTLDHPESFLISWNKPQDMTERIAEGRRQRYIEQQLAKQEQQLVAIRTQLRRSLAMLQDEAAAQAQISDTMQDMVRQQLPTVLEEIVHKNTGDVIRTMSSSAARNAQEIEENVHQRVVGEVMHMLERASDDVVSRVSRMVPTYDVEPPV
ncbi:uncharacterized protein LOC135809605 [Sycon ciliatum]|uniref:uncharacterized protein LOC135809605 n=1 Tax=Sycon ciliatum TaxID=27933 RepID=UPI0031F6409C